ncbi:SusC/RagA family TonB-linked outer membrane protein [Bacteroidia bacterium]|nr:SusC/RagA family TonB-linked outer membrane protein [Bacteroidia bacterium]
MKHKLRKFATGLLIVAAMDFAGGGVQRLRAESPQDVKIAVSGIVSDADGPVIGASVVERGNPSNGTATDVDGKYTLRVPSNATLAVAYLGYASQEVPVTGRTSINITLSEDSKALEEVVVIGYGVQRKEAVTGSVASINGDVMRNVPASNISQALQGRVAGVEMAQSSSKPGAEMQIRIRGTRSLTASNDPLVVLDGIPFAGSIGDIDPNNIKSIDILKDASATAIYGSRGANGVILVSTLKGVKGAKAQVSYNGYYGAKTVFAKYPMMDGEEFAKLRKFANQYTNGLDEADDVNTDWQDLFYRPAMVTNHDLGISGGTEHGSYSFGVGYYKDEAIIPLQDYSRISLRANIDQEVGIFRFGLSSTSNYSINMGNNIGMFGVLSMSPLADPYNADGSFKRTVRMAADEQWVFTEEGLNDLKDTWVDQTKALGSYNTLYGEIKIPGVDGLKYRLNVGLNFRMSNGGAYTGEGINNSNATNPSTASVSNSLTTNWAVENLLTYDKTFADVHQINAVAMYSAEQTQYNRSRMAAKDIPSEQFQFYNLGHAEGEKTIAPDDQEYRLSGLLSYMGRVMYSYDSRYMLSATVRSDASSRLAPGHQWHTYPAVSAGWNIKRESFMDAVDWLGNLKLRVGYGETSNQSVDPYATLGRLSTRAQNFGPDGYATGFYVSTLPNPNLGWEYSTTWNYGLDFSVLNNRLSGTIEYYSQHTKDILLSVDLPPTSGVGSYMANIGETENKGLELALNGVILNNLNGFTWTAGINLYANRNKLLKLASGKDKDVSNTWFVGSPIDVIYDYKKIGLWQEGDPYLDILEGAAGQAGMIKVEYTGEYNADGTPARAISSDDRQVLNIEPNFQGGFNTQVSYKGFDLGMVGAFKNGGTLLSTIHSQAGQLNCLRGRRGNIKVDYWTPDNTGAKYPKPNGVWSGEDPKYGSTLGYFDASYLKVRTITLGYTFNQPAVKNLGIQNLRLYATVQNPFVLFSPFNDESGMDPETNSKGDENIAIESNVTDRLLVIGTNTPTTRNYLFGISLTF